ncbi:hypothetical protein CLF_107197 [Clonorchis sinensis]|uniref:C2H2-type domain-containing protein n=1 Tax=Clonorchis sinensis TaxID=79923 RepID=G7YGB5_CLOSI|nr:hypothetical protein CLF_107197 [Clonorchis sinensis]
MTVNIRHWTIRQAFEEPFVKACEWLVEVCAFHIDIKGAMKGSSGQVFASQQEACQYTIYEKTTKNQQLRSELAQLLCASQSGPSSPSWLRSARGGTDHSYPPTSCNSNASTLRFPFCLAVSRLALWQYLRRKYVPHEPLTHLKTLKSNCHEHMMVYGFEFTMLRYTPYYHVDHKPASGELRTLKHCVFDGQPVFGAMPESDGNIRPVMRKYVAFRKTIDPVIDRFPTHRWSMQDERRQCERKPKWFGQLPSAEQVRLALTSQQDACQSTIFEERPQYRSELAQQLSTVNQYSTGSEHVDEAWQNVKGAMLVAFSAVCPTFPIRPQDHWLSSKSLSMIDARKSIPACNGCLVSTKVNRNPHRRLGKVLCTARILGAWQYPKIRTTMNCTYTNKLKPNRPSHGAVSWIALLAAYSRKSHKREVDRSLFIVSAYAPTDCSSDAVKERCYDALNALLRETRLVTQHDGQCGMRALLVVGVMVAHGLRYCDRQEDDSGPEPKPLTQKPDRNAEMCFLSKLISRQVTHLHTKTVSQPCTKTIYINAGCDSLHTAGALSDLEQPDSRCLGLIQGCEALYIEGALSAGQHLAELRVSLDFGHSVVAFRNQTFLIPPPFSRSTARNTDPLAPNCRSIYVDKLSSFIFGLRGYLRVRRRYLSCKFVPLPIRPVLSGSQTKANQGYPASLIRRQLRRVLVPVEKPKREWLGTAVIPYKPGTSETIRRILNTANIRVGFQRGNTLRSALVQLKDRLPANRTRDCVYKIKCSDCIKVYIGQTARELHTRIVEHKRKINKPPRNADEYRALLKDSAIAEHALDTGHKIDLENVEVLRRGLRSTSQRLMAEAVEIAKHPSVSRIEGVELARVWRTVLDQSS